MDFRLSSEQQALTDSVASFCARDYDFEHRRFSLANEGGFSPDNWQLFAELGWLGAGLGEDAGGYGGGAVENAIILEAFGRALVVEPFLACAVLALQTLAALPKCDARDQLIADIVSGEKLAVLAHNESEARGDVERVGMTAYQVDGQWRLNGAKQLVLGAPAADWLIVSARAGPDVALFLVAPSASGVELVPYRTLDNMRAADIDFEEAPAHAVLALPGAALPAIRLGYAHAMTAMCAEAVGAMDAAILLARDYLKTRQQFGTPLAGFQALQHRMADMLVEAEMSRSIVFQGLASLSDSEPERQQAIAAMKIVVSSAAMFVGRNAVQLHGGIGMTEEHPVGHYYKRLFVIAGLFGGEAFHLSRLASIGSGFW